MRFHRQNGRPHPHLNLRTLGIVLQAIIARPRTGRLWPPIS